MLKRSFIAAGLALFTAASVQAQASEDHSKMKAAKAKMSRMMTDKMAMAHLLNKKGEMIGHIHLMETGSGLKISVQAMGLKPGTHAIHFHQVGKCEAPQFTSAGGHLNPANKSHGLKHPKGPHLGDLPNIVAASDGTVSVHLTAKATIKDLFKPGGTAMVIHSGKDDYISQPAGNAGDRESCGVIMPMHSM